MKRRAILGAGCALCGALAAGRAWTQGVPAYAVPPRFGRPGADSDEGGLWGLMEREERALRRSPLLLRDEALTGYVQGIACRLGKEHCPDIRIFIVRTPQFNASMAPNGMMQVWSGLLLRIENEAQLAAIIGHEIGHYLQRHSLERLRDIKSRSALNHVLGLFGWVGLLGQVAVLAGAYGYSRDHEREADHIGAALMQQSDYDVAEAAKVWANLLAEAKAREGGSDGLPLFATHPAPPERQENLAAIARALPGGKAEAEAFRRQIDPFIDEWLQDEVKRGQYAESLVLLSRQVAGGVAPGLTHHYRGELYRLRGQPGDQDLALADYRAAAAAQRVPPAAYRGQGLIHRQRGQRGEALDAFRRYLELAPDSPDAEFIKSYIEELSA
jgi:predicted Zn-dependent protease